MIPLVPYSESSESEHTNSDSEQENKPTLKNVVSDNKDKKKINSDIKPTKPKIPCFLDTFDKVEDPSFLEKRKSEKKDVVKYFDLNKPIMKEAMSAEESKKDQEKKQEELRKQEEQKKQEEEKRNEEERQERVRQEKQLMDELYLLRREGREKWNRQQKCLKRSEKNKNIENAKKWKGKE